MKTPIGIMPCQCCGWDVVVKENEKQTLSYSCDKCGDPPYQRPGTEAAKIWRGKLKPLPWSAPVESTAHLNESVPAAKPVPPVESQTKKPKGTFFDE